MRDYNRAVLSVGNHPAPPGFRLTPTRLVVLSLLPLLAWLPPETRGESMAGCAALIALVAMVCWNAGIAHATAQSTLVASIACAGALSWASTAPAAAVVPVSAWLVAAAAGLAAAWSSEDERLVRAAVWTLVIAAFGVALLALTQRLWGLERWTAIVEQQPDFPDRAAVLTRLGRGRTFAAFATPAALAGYLVMSLPVTLGLALSREGRVRWLLSGAAVVQIAALLTAASATATAALLAALLFAALVWGRRGRRLLVAALVPLVLLLAVAWMRSDRLLDLEDAESPWRLRAGNMRAAAAMAVDHPWIGVGPGGFAERYGSYRRPGDNESRHAHNLPLEFAAEWGWPVGVALSALFYSVFLLPLWRERRASRWRRGLALGLAAFALQNLADFTAFMPSLLWSAALLCGFLQRPSGPAAARSTPSSRVLAGAGLTAVLIAAATSGLSGLAWNARNAARAAVFAGEREGALRTAERSVRLAPWDIDAALLLARLTADAELGRPGGDADLVVERTEHVVRLSPTRAASRDLRARVRLATGDLPGAYADLAAAARLHPVHEEYGAARDRLLSRIAPAGEAER